MEETGDWRKLHNKELHIFVLLTKCYSDENDRKCSIYGEKRNAYTVLMGKLGRKRAFGRPR
jgi:hypothetical protein